MLVRKKEKKKNNVFALYPQILVMVLAEYNFLARKQLEDVFSLS